MVGYADNNMRDTYKVYNKETKIVIMTMDVKWEYWKKTNPVKTLKMFRKAEKECLVPGIEEDVIPTSKLEENMPVHVIPDEGERVSLNEIFEKSSEITYLKKDIDTDISAYNIVFNVLNKIDTSHNPTLQKMHNPVIEGNYKVTGGTKVIQLVEHKDDEIQWACSKSISTDSG